MGGFRRPKRGAATLLRWENAVLELHHEISQDLARLDERIDRFSNDPSLDPVADPHRGDILAIFQHAFKSGRARLRASHLEGATGLQTVRGHTFLMDALLTRLFLLLRPHDLHQHNDMALFATGGYGRGELAPHSDVDLLFLIPENPSAEMNARIEKTLYFLWDLGVDLGQAVRTLTECRDIAAGDLEVQTSLLESRFLSGNRELAHDFRTVMLDDTLVGENARDFFHAKMREMKERHERFGNSRFYLEPNIKENPGGLRDIHTFGWISKYRFRVNRVRELIPLGIITEAEHQAFNRCREFLRRVRCALHYQADRREDRLTFNYQLEIAREFGYRDRPGHLGVEQFMRRYYQVANQVGALSQIFLQKYEEELTMARGPAACQPLEDVFELLGDKIHLRDEAALEENPVRLMRLFHISQRRQRAIHPEAVRMVTRNLHLVRNDFRNNLLVNHLFLEMFDGTFEVAPILERMNACGFLGRFIPEFGRINGQTQHDMFHVFTVDEHSIRAVDALEQLRRGEFANELPIATELMARVDNPVVLYLAVLFHDIAKGRGGDHEIKGAVIAQSICGRLGLPSRDIEQVVWLVRNHLVFSRIAFRLDISDPKTVNQFARDMGNRRNMDLLVLLTVADIRAVGPGVWTQWKGTLLRRLYQVAIEALNKGLYRPQEMAQLAERQRQEVERILVENQDPAKVARHLDRFYPDYFIHYDPQILADHYLALEPFVDEPLGISFRTTLESDTTQLLVHTQDHPGLMAKISGALASEGANILFASANTTKDGMSLEIFILQDNQGGPIQSSNKIQRIERTLERVLSGTAWTDQLLNNKTL
ncbi:MAG: [protein-PII] uridylyltransferase, partial [Magnetococcus sp. WYHC-3]